MSRRIVKKETKRLGDQTDDIELRDTFDDPINAGKAPSPYDIPKEDRAAASHSFASDIDQQKLLAQVRSEVAAIKEEIKSLTRRVDALEKSRA